MTAGGPTRGRELLRLAAAIADLASAAGAAVARIAAEDRAVRAKADASPVTAADEAAEAILAEGLGRLLPGVPVIAEEAASRRPLPVPAGPYLLVDPIDGTRELVAGRDEYTVNVALIADHAPALGVLFAPRLNALYLGAEGRALRAGIAPGARYAPDAAEPIRARPRGTELVALASRSHPDPESAAFLARLKVARTIELGSSLKFARLAEGTADVYARLAPVNEWDIAAGQALLAAAGGRVTAPDGSAIRFGARASGFLVDGFVAWGAPAG